MSITVDENGHIKANLREELTTGIWPNNFDTSVPFWKDGLNVRFSVNGIEKVKGNTALTDTGQGTPIRGLLQNLEGVNGILYIGTLTEIFSYNDSDSSITDISNDTFVGLAEGGSTSWDTGTTSWDAGGTLWDTNLGIIPTHWSMVSYGLFVLATNGQDKPQIKKNNVTFNALPGGLTGITITAPGSGYTVGDPVTISGGGGSGATAEVSEALAGSVTQVKITDGGTGYTSDPTATFTVGTGATGTAQAGTMDVDSIEIFVKLGPHVLGFNTSASEREFVWCSAGDVDDWVATATNSAGQLNIRELNSPIIAAVALGDRVAVYGTDQMFLVSYVQAPNYMGYLPTLTGVGAVSKHAVVSVGRRNFGLSQQGFFVTDGVTLEYIDDPQVREHYKSIKGGLPAVGKTVAYNNEEYNEVRWYFPANGSITNNSGLAYNYKTGQWSILADSISAASEREVFPNPVAGKEAGTIQTENDTFDNQGQAVTATATSKNISLDMPGRFKEITELRVGGEDITGLRVRLGYSLTQDGAVVWGSYQTVSAGFARMNQRVGGEYLALELDSVDLGASWKIENIIMVGKLGSIR